MKMFAIIKQQNTKTRVNNAVNKRRFVNDGDHLFIEDHSRKKLPQLVSAERRAALEES